MCDCIGRINAQLAEEGKELVLSWPLDDDMNRLAPRVRLETIFAVTRRKSSGITATYCPVCGKKYVERVSGESHA